MCDTEHRNIHFGCIKHSSEPEKMFLIALREREMFKLLRRQDAHTKENWHKREVCKHRRTKKAVKLVRERVMFPGGPVHRYAQE